MNWEALGAIAVFVSLLYVAVQIRQNTKQFSRSVEANQLAAFERNVESSKRIREISVEHDPLEFEGTARMLDEMLVNEGARDWLEENEPDWRPAFREPVDKRLSVIRQREAAKQQEAEPRA